MSAEEQRPKGAPRQEPNDSPNLGRAPRERTTLKGERTTLERLKEDAAALRSAHRELSARARTDFHGGYAAEWFLDNYYLIRGAIIQAHKDLPRSYYFELPRSGGAATEPRVYHLARRLVGNCDAPLGMNAVAAELNDYQQRTPLTIGELWALPAFLRLALLANLAADITRVTAADEAGALDEERVANSIVSLRQIHAHDWKPFIEEHSVTEQILRGDSAGAYSRMDFPTRDRYRKAVESLARASGAKEPEVAHAAVALSAESHAATPAGRAASAAAAKRAHVGYYLIGEGAAELRARLGYEPNAAERARLYIYRNPSFVYLSATLLITALLLLIAAAHVTGSGGTAGHLLTALLVGLVPALGIGVGVVNLALSELLPPRLLPKLDFSRGVPAEYRTAVAVPALLSSAEGVDELIKQLERHYLGNPEVELLFVLLTDHLDANAQTLPGDAELLARAKSGVAQLNREHGGRNGEGPFYLLHRERRYNPSEDAWMGWERKRGKLMEFNRLLRGDAGTSYTETLGDTERLLGVRYVLTLDADTRLPPGAAHRLIGTLAHPLNRAEFDERGRVAAGYSILQPRTEILPESANATYYSRLFVGENGLDLYTLAVSDVYQDLFGAGIYVGKGLYDVDDFSRALKGRVPENSVLSHDLLEGIYGGVGLVTDVVLYEEYPPTYLAQVLRMQRWIRGDWQLLPWLAGRFAHGGRALGPIGTWKVFDNLRRSLLMPTVVLMLLLGYTLLPGSPLVWTLMALGALLVPLTGNAVVAVMTSIIRDSGDADSWRSMVPWRQLLDALRRFVIITAFSMFEAVAAIRSVLITLYRLFVSRRRLLEWRTAAQAESSVSDLTIASTALQMRVALALTIAALLLVILINPSALIVAWPIFALWFASPLIAHGISQSLELEPATLTEDERLELRLLARRTWHYFEQFVGPTDNWLPPDNVQLGDRPLTAHRTSPTNIGLDLLSTLSAYDLGYLGLIDLSLRLSSTLESVGRLERYRGHLLNWYDTRTLAPLAPRYVSAVDNGNLAGALIALREGCFELLSAPVQSSRRWDGLIDTLAVLMSTAEDAAAGNGLAAHLRAVSKRVSESAERTQAWPELFDYLVGEALPRMRDELLSLLAEGHLTVEQRGALRSWAERVRYNVNSTQREFDFLLPWNRALTGGAAWASELSGAAATRFARIGEHFADGGTRNLRELAAFAAAGEELTDEFLAALNGDAPEQATAWARALKGRLRSGARAAAGLEASFERIAAMAAQEIDGANFGFLYDGERELLHIGYNVDAEALDQNYYDLLASESRLASLVGIAKGDLPVRHWLHLGRPLTDVNGRAALLSWSGTMFEYLMPNLLTRRYGGTLLEQACAAAVRAQIAYANEHRTPFGISESGYGRVDSAGVFQYRAFGVPTLALDRGQEDDLVIAPYASALALEYAPKEVMANFRNLSSLGALGQFGLYEALDFTPTRRPLQRPYRLVNSYMAHHQGMILTSLTNALTGGALVRRFHADPRVATIELLLQERIPSRVPVAEVVERAEPRPDPTAGMAGMSPWRPPLGGAAPEAHLLSNGHYTALVTAAGAGHSSYDEVAITRESTDPTLEELGTFIYVHDHGSGELWSVTRQPLGERGEETVEFTPHSITFTRKVDGLLGRLEVAVAEVNAELRRVTLINQTGLERRVTLTSYAEAVIGDAAGDRRHPAFSKLFVESRFDAELGALLLRRRPRSASEKPLYAAHALLPQERSSEGSEPPTPTPFESDRLEFLGRGRGLKNPVGPARGLSNSAGATLDPVMALAHEVVLPPHSQTTCTFVTAYGAAPVEIAESLRRLRRPGGVQRGFELAAERSRQELRRLHAEPREPRLFQRLLSALLYPRAAMRAEASVLAANRLGQSGLWGQGISGDYPILLLKVGEEGELELVADAVRAHGYWRRRGVKVDLVILNTRETNYSQELQGRLRWLLSRSGGDDWLNARGGIYLVREDQLAQVDRTLLLSAARVVLRAEKSLEEQLGRLDDTPSELPALDTTPAGEAPTSAAPQPAEELLFANGWGGFAQGGKEYRIDLPGASERALPPAPWSNVIANEEVGFLATESGMGSSWSVNSGENRLTTWRNDPVSDAPAEVIYLRDEETGQVWSATPLPSSLGAPFTVRHGVGYTRWSASTNGLDHELEALVAAKEPVKLMRMRVRNTSERVRRVTLTYYAELVLGIDPFTTRAHLIPEYVGASGTLLATNPYNSEFGERVAFAAASRPLHGLTADRCEFLGRFGSLELPAALTRIGLSGRVEAGVDPCAALQVHLDLRPGEEQEALFVLGQAENRETALALAERYRNGAGYEERREEAVARWRDLLGGVQVKTPDPVMNVLVNGWLNYQTVSARLFGRSGFYQSSGAYGFRDQLQDVLALLYTAPELARAQLLRAAAHQFEEGDVLHWWHPPSGRGVRTRITDDLLWLPYVAARYVEVTGDESVLSESAPYLSGPELGSDEQERYDQYEQRGSGSLLEHCLRAIERGATRGVHGLTLMGGGDWNDGMNRVGAGGRGESVWLTWFLMVTLERFAELLRRMGRDVEAAKLEGARREYAEAAEQHAWDGEWYLRAYYDDGFPLGSERSDECQIDAIAQSWSLFALGDHERGRQAMRAVNERLVREEDGLIRLFTPAFDRTTRDPGYIKGYLPGVRENGGQYTHGAIWTAWAFTLLKDGRRALELFRLLAPVLHGATAQGVERYKVEPYVIAADVYSLEPHVGRGGWTWYTGSAAWLYRLAVERMLGIEKRGERLTFSPCLDPAWEGYEATWRHGESVYRISVVNGGANVARVTLNGAELPGKEVPLERAPGEHAVVVELN